MNNEIIIKTSTISNILIRSTDANVAMDYSRYIIKFKLRIVADFAKQQLKTKPKVHTIYISSSSRPVTIKFALTNAIPVEKLNSEWSFIPFLIFVVETCIQYHLFTSNSLRNIIHQYFRNVQSSNRSFRHIETKII